MLLGVMPLGINALTNIALAVSLVYGFIFLKGSEWRSSFSSPLVYSIAALYGLYALSLLWTSNLEEGLRGLETKLSFILMPPLLVAAAAQITPTQRKLYQGAFVVGVLGACLWALAHACWLAFQEGAWYYDPGDGFGRRYFLSYVHLAKPVMHPGYFSTYIGLAIFSTIPLLRTARKRWPYYLLLLLFFVMMVLLQGRINLAALLLVAGAGSFFYALKKKVYVVLVLPAIAVALFLLFLVVGSPELKARYLQLPNMEYDISGEKFNSATYRLAEWRCAVDVVQENPWFGTGIGDYKSALLNSYAENKFWKGLEEKFNAHNQYLETTLAIGFLGLMLLLYVVFVYVRHTLRHKDYVLLAGLAFFVLSMLTESMLERAWATVLFCVFFPLFAALSPKAESKTGV
jgi:O-antigen ligase